MKRFLLSVLLILFHIPLYGSEQVILDAPECAHWHKESRTWFVSNLGGGISLAKDKYGWITRYDENGNLTASRWLEFLDAPTGMASVGNNLYIADRSGLTVADINSAKILKTIALPDSKFPNDVVSAPEGILYVSDFEANRIYKVLPDGNAEIWLEGEYLENPNGLWIDGDNLVIATWGPITDMSTFASKHKGKILKADLKTKNITVMGNGNPIANFDGIIKAGIDFYATGWIDGKLLRITESGEVKEILSGLPHIADLGYSEETNTIALPLMKDNRIIFLKLNNLK